MPIVIAQISSFSWNVINDEFNSYQSSCLTASSPNVWWIYNLLAFTNELPSRFLIADSSEESQEEILKEIEDGTLISLKIMINKHSLKRAPP